MKLTLAPYSPNPRRVAMFIAEKQISGIEIETIDLVSGVQRTPDYLARSPLGQAPLLELGDGRRLTESRAICLYLESLHPEPNLFGAEGYERAHVEMWDRRAELLFAIPLMLWVRNLSPLISAVELNQNAAYGEANRDVAMRMAQFLDRTLAEQPFIAGERFTIADITTLAGMDFAKMVRWRPGDDLPHLKAWRARMAERPAGQVPP